MSPTVFPNSHTSSGGTSGSFKDSRSLHCEKSMMGSSASTLFVTHTSLELTAGNEGVPLDDHAHLSKDITRVVGGTMIDYVVGVLSSA